MLATPCTSQKIPVALSNPLSLPRSKSRAPTPKKRVGIPNVPNSAQDEEDIFSSKIAKVSRVDNNSIIEEVVKEVITPDAKEKRDDAENDIFEDFSSSAKYPIEVESVGEKLKILETINFQQKQFQETLNEDKISSTYDATDENGGNTVQSTEMYALDGTKLKDNSVQTPLENVIEEETTKAYLRDDSYGNTLVSSEDPSSDKKLPEVVAVIPKTPSDKKFASPSKFDTFGRRRFQTGITLSSFEDDQRSLQTKRSESGSSTGTSVASALANFNFMDEFSDLDENVFHGSVSSAKNFSLSEDVYNQLFGMHHLEDAKIDKNQSISSLRSLRSLYGISNDGGMTKWKNTEDLDNSSLASLGRNSRWVIGDSSDSESLISRQALDSLASITSTTSNISPAINEDEIKPFGSTDSGIAPEVTEKDSDDYRPITPPPPPLFLDDPVVVNTIITPEVDNTKKGPVVEPEAIQAVEIEATSSKDSVPPKKAKTVDSIVDERLTETVVGNEDNEVDEIDWQYQLPSPPKAFRDSSPVNLPDGGTLESQSVTDFKDSVVTSPELFEKLKNIEDLQSERETITSDLTSVISEDDRTPLMNILSLENLERRKSLVYNRELATSLKMNDDIEVKYESTDTFSSSLTKFEDTLMEIQNSSQQKPITETKHIQQITATSQAAHTLPNFKISTYDQPKRKIKVFEDDTVRSNTDNINKMHINSLETSDPSTSVGRSMENISRRKNSVDELSSYSNEEKEYIFFKPEKTLSKNFGPASASSVFRSESFSRDNWAPSKPVLRSKSHLTLDAHKYIMERRESVEEGMSRSNSLYDVSGLQSLGVMRLIQNKLSTPTTSMENLNIQERRQKSSFKPEFQKKASPLLPPSEIVSNHSETVENPPDVAEEPPATEKIYKYSGPPSINMGTWSERPKMPVSVKEDADYTLGNVSSKLIVNSTNNNITSNNTIEVRSDTMSKYTNQNGKSDAFGQKETNNFSIKVNGTETSEAQSRPGNVVIKIGNINSQAQKTIENHRFISHTTAAGYRKPFSTLYKNQRPHSVAFDSDFDISRVPVVRSVELKKPFKGIGNTSVTQINNQEPVSELKTKFSSMYRSSENLSTKINLNHTNGEERDTKPVLRVGSYKPTPAPVVRGFKTNNEANWANRLSWNPPSNFNTLPNRPKEKGTFSTNSQVSFSQLNLRKTDSSKILENNVGEPKPENPSKSNRYNSLPDVMTSEKVKVPPPPPQMPKVTLKKPVFKPADPVMDQRSQMLSAIRNFGGKKGLKSVRA
ncbi:hypothetical protein JTB14_026585 [Gonioctena quinquepunctata]|nr:hypothetical protein JTB14_026585 [Gonioctena quinquepunctata]